MAEFIELSKIERQLLLYEIFLYCNVTEFAEITTRLPINQRMIQRDFKTLRRIGHNVGWDSCDHCFIKDDDFSLREDFDVKRQDGKLIRRLWY